MLDRSGLGLGTIAKLVGCKAAGLIYGICGQPARRNPLRRALNPNELVVPAAPEDDPPRQIVAAAARRQETSPAKFPKYAPGRNREVTV
jgi:hypothetical protein